MRDVKKCVQGQVDEDVIFDRCMTAACQFEARFVCDNLLYQLHFVKISLVKPCYRETMAGYIRDSECVFCNGDESRMVKRPRRHEGRRPHARALYRYSF